MSYNKLSTTLIRGRSLSLEQPLHAIAKQIQWNWPSGYGEDKFVILLLVLGGLHFEMAFLATIGDLLDGVDGHMP